MGVKIITDSACDLPKEIIEEYNVDVIPLMVYLDEKEYLDGETLGPIDLYNAMREGKAPKTAQVSYNSFKEKFTQCAENNESYIYIAFSSELSGTYQTSELVKQDILEIYPDFDLDIVNSKCASMGFGLVVYKAAQMAREGKTKEEIIEAVKFHAKHMEHIFTVDDLVYLFRGGRVSRTSAFLGGVLNIKPVLNVEDGKLVPIEKIRGRNKTLKRMIEIMNERGVDLKNQTIGISHGDDHKAAMKIKKMIEENFGCDKFVINIIGSVIGAHSGPGTLAVYFLNEEAPIE